MDGEFRRSVNGIYEVAADHSLTYKVALVDDLLAQTFPAPVPGTESALDILGRVPGGSMRRLVVVDRTVYHHYGSSIQDFLTRHGVEYRVVTVPGGEKSKRFRTVLRLCRIFEEFGVSRFGEPIIIFGGGVLLDVAGLAASLYRRGVPRIVIATTLLAAVDAALGVKTAADFLGQKNRLGAYSAPLLATVSREFLATLEPRRLSDGFGEILKLGVAVDRGLFGMLEHDGKLVLSEAFQGATPRGDSAAVSILSASLGGTLGQLAPNILEGDTARAMNAGHNVSPVIEMASLRASRHLLPWRRRRWLLHGEAVALDLLLCAGLSLQRHLITDSEYDRITNTIDTLGLPHWDPLLSDPDLLAAGLRDSARHRGGQQLVPLPKGIGAVEFANDITSADLAHAIARQRSLGGRCIA
jgi:3-dehydroquinate synthetase